jgi:tryptophan synthase beta subunit
VRLVGVEAGGTGIEPGSHAARLSGGGSAGVIHGTFTWLLQDDHGQIEPTHSVAAGLDYPAVGPEHAMLHHRGRVRYESVTDAEALDAFEELAAQEGIIPALESAHALAGARRLAAAAGREATIVINLSGRGDKDVDIARQHLDLDSP